MSIFDMVLEEQELGLAIPVTMIPATKHTPATIDQVAMPAEAPVPVPVVVPQPAKRPEHSAVIT